MTADVTEKTFTIVDLVYLMKRLRDPQRGCPWDLKQTYRSIVPSTLEEVYEVVEAIENNDIENLREELGDLLFQVVFYSQMASEEKHFDFDEVAHTIVAKLVRRHPHVFPSGNLYDDSAVQPLSDVELHAQWERIKQEEKRPRQSAGSAREYVLDGIPAAIPALQRAYKLQKKLATVGFDWQHAEQLFPVVEQEIGEVREAVNAGSVEKIEEELGDVLFAVVNLCRHLQVDPESALRRTNDKVRQRFAYIEDELDKQGKTPQQAGLAVMEDLWQQAKQRTVRENST